LAFGRHIDADNLFIIAREHVPVGKGRMRPDHGAIPNHLVRWLQDVSARQFLVTLGSQVGDNQIALFVKEKKVIALFD
jgi:hypothetical protein